MLPRTVQECIEHDHRDGNYQGIGNQWIVPLRVPRSKSEAIDRRTRLGGMLGSYAREAA